MRVAFRSKNEVIYDLLRTSIIRGEYPPGSRLIIDELAASLGVSQIPIRESMRQLEADGFITFEPYVGAKITEINADLIFEVFALLENMEVICSRAAIRRMTDADLKALADLVYRMDSSVSDPEQWSQDNKELHLFICQCAKTGLTLKFMQNVLAHWDRLRFHYLKDVFGNRIKVAQQEHKQILEAFRTRNPDEVERVIREHNRHALTSYIQHLRSTEQIQAEQEGYL
jgi:DNA-binding GntR family transcriptional regulator